MSSTFSRTAAEVHKLLADAHKTKFSKIASEVCDEFKHHLSADRDAEWQRVNSYVADTLKDTHVLYAKLARLQGDFAGAELDQLQKISEAVLILGDELSVFSKDFYNGKYEMQQSEFIYGDRGGEPVPNPKKKDATPPAAPPDDMTPPPPSDAPPPPPPSETFDVPESDPEPEESDDDENYDMPIDMSDFEDEDESKDDDEGEEEKPKKDDDE